VILFAATTFLIPIIGAAFAGTVLLGVFLIAGLCRGILRVTTAATIADIRREGRDIGLSSGVYNAGLDLGSIVGPIAGGLVSTAFGIPTMFQILAVAALVLYFGVSLSSPKGRATLVVFGSRVPADR